MPTSHPNSKPNIGVEFGFSLLEMLIVLAIMGMMLSLVSVRLVSSLESTQFAKTADAAMDDIKHYRVEAMLDKKPVRIVNSDETKANKNVRDVVLNLPAEWIAKGDNINISRTGYCSGGQLTLIAPSNRRASFELMPPKCDAERVSEPSDTIPQEDFATETLDLSIARD